MIHLNENTKLIYKNPKEFFRRWGEGIKNLTPAQQLHAKLVGQIGNMVGLVFAWAFLIFKGFWFFSISMAFVLFMLFIDHIGTRQQYKATCKSMDDMKELDNLKFSEEENHFDKIIKEGEVEK